MKWDTRMMAGRLASVAAIWGVSQALSTEKGKKVSRSVDQRANRVTRKASTALRRGRKNARNQKGWLAAGLASLAVGTALLGRAMKK